MKKRRFFFWLVFVLEIAPSVGGGEVAESREPFAFADFTWMNGQDRRRVTNLLATKYLNFGLYIDTNYNYTFSQPQDNTVVGNSTLGRTNEFQLNLISGSFEANYENVVGHLALQYGNMLSVVEDQDGTVNHGKNLSAANLKYIREAGVAYHFDTMYGLNLEMGIFPSYMGLESYLLEENWTYQRSFVCEMTPFYFTGIRTQIFPRRDLKIEPWLINGWQTYGKWNQAMSFGFSTYYRPSQLTGGWLGLIANFYYGYDTPNDPGRLRFHHDHSVLVKYYDRPSSDIISKAAITINNHYGFQSGGSAPSPSYVAGTSVANRVWFSKDLFALTLRFGYVTNPSRYLALQGPVAAYSGNSLQLTEYSATLDVMPTESLTVRLEFTNRNANIPYFAGSGGTTSADGYVPSATPAPAFTPTLEKSETRALLSAMFRM